MDIFDNLSEKQKEAVQTIDEELFINNTEYVEDMSDYRWKPLSSEL